MKSTRRALVVSGLAPLAFVAGPSSAPAAGPLQDIAVIERLAAAHAAALLTQSGTRGVVSPARLDVRLRLPHCRNPRPYLPAGSVLGVRTTIAVRCDGAVAWRVYVPVEIRLLPAAHSRAGTPARAATALN